ncbi:MAG TPA: glycosyltransferase family 4 protein [Ktedonobacterales bacterium]
MRLVVAHSRLTSRGGGERVTLELLRRLGARHEVMLWTGRFDPTATYAELAAFPRVELRSWEWLARRPNAGAVIANSFGASLLALRHPGTICYLHTLRSTYLLGGSRPDLAARRLLDRRALGRAAALVTNSAYTAAGAEQRYRRPVEVVPPGVDDAWLALPPRIGSYALYAGRLAPEKGIERLLAWSADLPLDVLIAGAGAPEYERRLRALAGPRGRFAGPLAGQALLDAYAGARFLALLPDAEEFGLAALEAMAASKPVVAFAGGGLPELVRHEQTGLLVRDAAGFADAARRLLASDELTARLGAAGREAAREYTWDRFARRIEEICEEHRIGR